jgi:tetratricopeptide (TPR) repeat protein
MRGTRLHRMRGVMLGVIIVAIGAAWADDKLSALIAEGKYDKAVEYADQSVPPASRTVDDWLLIALASDRMNADKEKVLRAFTEAQKVNPSDPLVYKAMGDYAMKSRNYPEALKHFQKWYLLERSAKAAESIAICAAKLKMWDKARDAAESAVNLDGNSLESRRILSEIYIADKDWAGAAKQLEAIVATEGNDVVTWKKLARCYEETANREKLAGVDPKIIELDKKDIVARRRMVEYSLDKKDPTTAYNLLRELAILTPDDAKVFRHLYQIAADKDLKKDAILYLKNFLVLDSSDAASYKTLGDLQFDQKNIDEALTAYRKALKLNPAITDLYQPYMVIVLDKKLEDEALSIAPGAIRVNEIDVATYAALGEIYKKRNRCGEAIDMYQNALKADAKNIAVLTALADCQAAAGKTNDAIITYEQVVLLNPDANKEHKALADLLSKVNKNDEAIQSYRKYLEKSPDDEAVAATIGLYNYAKRQYKDAIVFLERVKEQRLQTIRYHVALGQSYFQTGSHQKAADEFAKARAEGAGTGVLAEILKPQAECLEKLGNQVDAARAYEAYVKLPGIKDADASHKQAFLREGSDRKTAVSLYQANTAAFPQDARNFLRLGIIFSEDAATLAPAIEMLQKAAAITANDPVIWQKLNDAYHRTGNSERELATAVKLLSIEPDNQEANRRAGTILYKRKQYGQAIPYLEKVAAKSGQDAEILIMLADASVQTKNYNRAIEIYSKVKDLRPEDGNILLALIAASDAAGQTAKAAEGRSALAELDKKTVAKDAKNIESRRRLANYLLERKDNGGAYTLYKELAVLTPKDADVFRRLIDIAQKTGNTAEAITYLRQFVALEPTDAKAQLALGNLLYDQKDLDGALTSFRVAWKLDPALKGFFLRYGEIVVAKKLDDEAVNVLNAAIKNSETDPKTYITLGKIYQAKKQFLSAITMYKRASNDDPKNIEVLTLLGECQASSGDMANAIITYEQVVLLNPNASVEYKALGELQQRQNKTEEAIKVYKKYLEKTPSDEKIARIIGMYEYSKNNYPEAIRYLEMVKNSAVQSDDYLMALGDSYYRQGNCQKTTVLFALLRTRKIEVEMRKKILKPLGECYEKIGDAAKAAESYEAYTKVPGVSDVDASYLKAFLREKSDPKTAEELYLANIEAFPKDCRSFVRLGMIYLETPATLSKAAQMLGQGSLLNPKDVTVLQKLGQAWGTLKNEDRELAAYKKLLSIEPQNLEANRRAGAILLKKGQYSEALANLEIAQTMMPQDVDVMLMLADGYLKTNRQEKGIELLTNAKAIKKDDPDLILRLYELNKAAGKAKEAEEEIKQLIAIKKDNRLRLLYARDLVDQKRYDEALAVVNEIKKADPMNVDGLMLLGKTQSLQAKYDDAIETFKMVSYINENYAPAQYERAQVYRLQSNFSRAEQFYLKALNADPRYGLAELGLARLAKAQKNQAEYIAHLNKAKALDPNNKEILAELKEQNK